MSFLIESVARAIVGVAVATYDSALVPITGNVGGVADALGNSIGFFVSQATERAVQIRASENGENTHIHSKQEVYMSGVFSFLSTLAALILVLFPFNVP